MLILGVKEVWELVIWGGGGGFVEPTVGECGPKDVKGECGLKDGLLWGFGLGVDDSEVGPGFKDSEWV